MLSNNPVSVRELSRFLGKLNSSIQVVFPAPLNYRHLQRVKKNLALSYSQDYEALVTFTPEAREELIWWRDKLLAWNGKGLVSKCPDTVIETDASSLGGARCGDLRTGGHWSQAERLLHINCLELIAEGFALKSFVKDRCHIKILLLMDNQTSVAYLNKMGGHIFMHSRFLDLSNMAVVSQQRHNHSRITSTRVSKCKADEESRSLGDSSDWKLKPEIFQQRNLLWGPLEIDLFASRLTNQLPRYVSWKPDPRAEATDAFSLNWAQHRGYAFQPFVLIGRCLKQVMSQQVPSLVTVNPVWEMQSWFPLPTC